MSDLPRPPLRVLLLDDDAFMLALLAELVGELGPHEVSTESNSLRALATLRRETPQLLICDLAMPDMDGIEFLRCAAEDHYRGAVLLLSGVDQSVLQAAARLAQAHGLAVLGAHTKPLERAVLADLLAQAAAHWRGVAG